VRIAVFDVSGRLVASLLDGPALAGEHSIVWDGRDGAGREMPSGVYVVRLESDGHRDLGKLVLAR
jgi:flagellar hook assembly protein FlgD